MASIEGEKTRTDITLIVLNESEKKRVTPKKKKKANTLTYML